MDEQVDTEPPAKSLEIPTPENSVDDAQLREALRARLFGGDPEPTKIGRYSLLNKLGSGGMGVVYSAYDDELDRKIALKLLRPDLRGGGSLGRHRLKREAKAMAKLSHPNVATVHEVGEHETKVFVAMEFVSGHNLRRWLLEGERTWREIVAVFAQAGAGLAAAHEAGFVHRDFKPENVMVDDRGRPRVLDFGLARPTGTNDESDDPQVQAELDEPALTRTGTVMGTPAYMSPEQHRGEPADARADQFSFCVSLWEALYGERPFAGVTAREIAESIAVNRLRVPNTNPRVPATVRRALEKGLSFAPADRHPEMTALLSILRAAAEPKRSRGWLLAVGVVLAAVAGFAGYVGAKPEPVCVPASEWTDPVWGEQRKRNVREAILAVDAPQSEQAWNTLQTRLDAYVREWTRAYETSCKARADGGAVSLLDRQRADCLEQRIQELDGIPTLFEDADASLVTQVLPALSSVRGITGCLSEEGLALQVEPPRDPATAKAVRKLRIDLRRARAMAIVGRLDEALALNQKLAEHSETLAYPAAEAEAYLDLAILDAWIGQYFGGSDDFLRPVEHERRDRTREAFRHAIRAAQAARHDEVLAVATLRELDASGHGTWENVTPDDIERAEDLVIRLGDPPGLRAELLNVQARRLAATGDPDAGASLFRQQLELARREWPDRGWLGWLGGAQSRIRARAAANLSREGDFEEAQLLHEEAVATLEAEFGPTNFWLLGELGMGCEAPSGFEHKLALCDRALALADTNAWYARSSVHRGLLVYRADGTCELDEAECDARLAEAREACPNRAQCGKGFLNLLLARTRHSAKQRRIDETQAVADEWSRFVDAARTEVPSVVRPELDALTQEVATVLAQVRGEYEQCIEHSREAAKAWVTAKQPGRGVSLAGTRASCLLAAGNPEAAIVDARAGLAESSADEITLMRFGEVRFVLARAIWQSGGDRDEAIATAKQARDELAARLPGASVPHQEVLTWLEEHDVPGP